MIHRQVLTASVMACCGGYALADEAATGPQAYIGLGGAAFDLDTENTVGSNDDIQSSTLAVLFGVEFNEVLAFEVEAGMGSGDDDTLSRAGQSLDVGLNTQFGAYGKASLPVSKVFAIYGRVGYANVDYTIRDPSVGEGFEATKDASDSGLAVGGGMQFSFGRGWKNAIRADFTQINADTLPTQRYSISYIRRF